MAWSKAIPKFGVCGNFKFEIWSLTDIKATRSLIKPITMSQVHFTVSTNVTDGTDVLAAQTLAWTGTADGNTDNELIDSSEVFDPEIDGCQAHNTADNRTSYVTYKEATKLYCHKGGWRAYPFTGDAVYDLCPDGNETFTIYSERVVQVIAGTADDDGTLLIIGR